MDRYRLKNIMIIILALLNLALLASLAYRKTAERTAWLRTQEQLVELFAADGVELDGSIIPSRDPAAPLTMSRDGKREREVAAFFLGEALQYEDQGGDIYSYTNPYGVALFRGDGSFDVVGARPVENVQEACRSFCKKFSYGEPVFTLDEHGNGTAVATYLLNEQSVYNCTVTIEIEQGAIQMVGGTVLPESGVLTVPDRELLSASAALTAFQKMRRETGAVVSAVTEIYPCYRLQSTTAVPMSLVPAWCIVTDTSRYYVNCVSGAVTTG